VASIQVAMKTHRLLLAAAVAPVLLAGVHSWRGARLAERVEQTLAGLPMEIRQGSEGSPRESAEVVEARRILAEQLAWIGDRLETEDGWFGAPYTLTPDNLLELERGVRERATFFEALDALPESLWRVEGTPPSEPLPSLSQQLAMQGALGARAWLAARQQGDADAAGRDLTRGLAIARVTDNGLMMSLMIRTGTEYRVLSVLDAILELPHVDSIALFEPIREELERSLEQDRFQLGLDRDLRYLLAYETEVATSASFWNEWLWKPGILSERLSVLGTYQELRNKGLGSLTSRSAQEAADVLVHVVGAEEPAWMLWGVHARLELQRRDELTKRLASF
jgi:hypothetical protein